MDENIQQTPSPQQTPQVTPPLPEPPKTFGWLKWVLLIVIVALISSGGTYFVLQSKQNQQTQVIPTPSPAETSVKEGDLYREPTGSSATANWKTYINTKYGFSVKYPPDLVVSESGAIRLTNEASMPQVIPDKYINILIFVHSVDSKTDLREWIEKDTTRNRPDGTVGSIVVGTIENYASGNLQGFTYHGGAEVDIKHVLFKKGGKIFDFTLDCYETGCSYKDNRGAERLFNQILSTFKFLE